jgi:hypothetical protein
MSDTTLVVVGTYYTEVDADLAQTVLQAEGIESMIRADDCGGVTPGLWMRGISLLVRGEDAERAAAILAAPGAAAPAAADGE